MAGSKAAKAAQKRTVELQLAEEQSATFERLGGVQAQAWFPR